MEVVPLDSRFTKFFGRDPLADGHFRQSRRAHNKTTLVGRAPNEVDDRFGGAMVRLKQHVNYLVARD